MYGWHCENAAVCGKGFDGWNDNDARQFLEKKAQLVKQQESLKQSYDLAAANAAKMREMHDKLAKDLENLQAKRDAVKAKVAVAKDPGEDE